MGKRGFWIVVAVAWLGSVRAAEAAISLTPAPMEIGNVRLGGSGDTSAGLTSDVSLAVTLELGAASDCPQFQIVSPTALTIGPAASTVTVRLTPTSVGPKTCTLRVKQGAAVQATFDVTGAGTAPMISVDPPSIAFGDVEIFSRKTVTVTVTNIGTAPLFIGIGTGFVGNAVPFVGGISNGATIAAGDHQSFTLGCSPDTRSEGLHFGTYRISSTSLVGGQTDIPLTCNGAFADLRASLTTINFGTVLRGTTKRVSFTLTNPGNVAITSFSRNLLNGGGAGIGYVLDPAAIPVPLAPGATTTVTAAFAPQSLTDGGPFVFDLVGRWGTGGLSSAVTFSFNGDVTGTGFSVAPNSLDFGEFAFDALPQRSYQITNPGDTSVTIATAAFSPDPGTAITEIVQTVRDAGGGVVTLPQTLSPGQHLDVTVTASPVSRSGLVSGHIDVHSTIPGAVDQRVVVAGTATAAVVDAPALVDFGAVDVAGAAPTQSVTIKNTGTAVLTIPSVSRLAGSSDVFQATLPAGVTSLAPGMALAIPVTYQPAVAQAPGSYDTLTLVVALSGAVAGPGQSMITIRGRGIDRALELAAPPSFPPTAPNPGSAAPERAVTIRNRGEAVLQITALAITGAPVWQLVDDQPIAIAGGESHDVRIRFAPTALGPAPEGRLTLTSDDRAHATATVVLTGTGAHPDVALGPTTIDLGDVAIGAAATAELRITNHDATRAITVHDLVLDSPLFTVAGAAGSLIDAGMSRTFPVRFAPTASTTPGAVHATATLYVEGDPAPLAMVALTARALAADEPSGGGGGCATGAAPGSAGVLGLVTSLGLLGLARIRRRRAPRQV